MRRRRFNDNQTMQMHSYNPSLNRWGLRLATFSVAALAAASATFWALKWTDTRPLQTSAPVVFSSPAPTTPQAVARLLGGGHGGAAPDAPMDNAASNFKLTGVVANLAQSGYALIAVDGKPAKPYRVGEPVNDALVLRSVAPRSAALAANMDAPATVTLDLPRLAPP